MNAQNISKKLVFLIVVLGFGFTIIAGVIGVWVNYSREMAQIDKRIEQIEKSYIPLLAQSLWLEADEMLKMQLQGIYELPDMQYAEIEREGASYLLLGGKEGSGNDTHSFSIVHIHESGKKKIEMDVGKLNIQVDLEKVYSRLIKNIFITVLNQAFVLFCLACCMLFILKRIVVSPLRILKESAEKVSTGDFDHTIDIEQKDEFSDLAHSLEFMRSTIKDKINELHQVNDSLNSLNDELKTEIDERKKIEVDLREAEEKYRKIYENAVEGIFQTRPDGTIIGINPTMAKMFGYDSVDQVMASTRNIADYYVFQEHRAEFVKQITEHGKVLNFETQVYRENKEKFWVSVSARLIHGEKPEQNMYEGMVMDITARKERERAEEERKSAEAANLAKSRFLANMSHEIRTPMNAIIGLTDLALRTELTEKQADYLQKISLSANSLLGIINDILDFSKIEAGKIELEYIPFNLNEVLENLASLITLNTDKKGLELIFDVEKELPLNLIGDPLRLGQVLVNLTDNAVKFTEMGQIIIKITRYDESDTSKADETTLVFSVSDSGIGMSEEQIAKLFTSFSQADSSTTRKFGGTGLGLTICKRMVELMGGEIRVESNQGYGSTFLFTAKFGLQSTQPIERKKVDGQFAGMRVLVVDDNATSREIVVNALKDFSFAPEEAVSGTNALEMIENDLSQTPYKLILMDWRMPGMDGAETAKRIKTHPALPVKPHIIMLTAYGREEVRRRAESVGIDGFLVKPVNRSILFDAIMNLLGGTGRENTHVIKQTYHSEQEKDSFEDVRILLAEDNEINQQVAVELLETAGIEVDVVGNGRLAVEAVCSDAAYDKYDMVLMDIQMPEMDGYVATGRIREYEKKTNNRKMVIVAMTAHALDSEKERCREEGMDDHISKPIDPRLLFKTIRRWLIPSDSIESGVSDNLIENGDLPRGKNVPSPTPTGNMPKSLYGVNISAGLERVAGNEKLYLDILKSFSDKYRNMLEKILQSTKGKDFQGAAELTHGMKGVTGNIGAQKGFELLQALETALKNGDDEYEEIHRNVHKEISAVIGSIDEWFKKSNESFEEKAGDSPPADGEYSTADWGAVQQTFNDLKVYLGDYNIDAVELLASLEKLTQGRLRQELADIRGLVDELEFDQALKQLESLNDRVKP